MKMMNWIKEGEGEEEVVDTDSLDNSQGEMTLLAPLTCVCDGIFSRFRKIHTNQLPDVHSHFVGFVMDHKALELPENPLPMPEHGHVLLSGRAPVLMYQMSDTETRVLVDIPGKQLPKESSGELRKYLEKVADTLPSKQYERRSGDLREAYLKGLRSTKRIRAISNSFFPPTQMRIPGAIFIGDAMNQRHPLTGGGMTVGLWDAIQICQLLSPENVSDLRDADQVLKAMAKLHWQRKPRAMVINILAMALYSLFAADSEELSMLRASCFEYFMRGGNCVDHPSGLLSGLVPNPLLLLYHFFSVAIYAMYLEIIDTKDSFDFLRRLSRSLYTLWVAALIFFPLVWRELQP